MAPGPDDTAITLSVPPLIAIVGETGSGKSAMALKLAQRFNGEIICADSRTVYKGMDIGTAKPSAAEQRLVPHHLLDVMTPDQHFTAAQFKESAQAAITDITARGKLPFLVGGTGLYADAVLYDFSFRPPADPAQRATLAGLSVEELQALLEERGIPLPKNARNPRHLVRALETDGEQPRKGSLRTNTILLCLQKDRVALREVITRRVDVMLAAGLVDEVRRLAKTYGWDAPGLQAPGYVTFRPYLEGEVTLDEARTRFIQSHMQLAKRQRTWFKRNPDIRYISKIDEAVAIITSLLNN